MLTPNEQIQIAERIAILIKTNGLHKISPNTAYDDMKQFSENDIWNVIERMMLHDFFIRHEFGIAIGPKFDSKSISSIFQLSELSLPKSNSKILTTPNTISTLKNKKTIRWGTWGLIWRIIVGIGVIIGIWVGIAQLNEWGYFDPLVPSSR